MENKENIPGNHLIVSQEVADKLKEVLEPPYVLEGVTVQFSETNSGRNYTEEAFSKSLKESTHDAGEETEMSAEDQQRILKQIIESTKSKGLKLFNKKSKTVSADADKKRKSKNKAAKKSRKLNHKKKK